MINFYFCIFIQIYLFKFYYIINQLKLLKKGCFKAYLGFIRI